jgi:hypothetical protein
MRWIPLQHSSGGSIKNNDGSIFIEYRYPVVGGVKNKIEPFYYLTPLHSRHLVQASSLMHFCIIKGKQIAQLSLSDAIMG